MAMEAVKSAFASAFQTERLTLCTLEDKEAHRDWIWKNIWSNSVNMGLASANILTPPSERTFKSDVESIVKNSHIAALICLKPAEAAKYPNQEAHKESKGSSSAEKPVEEKNEEQEEEKKKKKKKVEEETFIGIIMLFKPGSEAFRRRASIGIQIAEKYQNKGYGREAINWALDWAFLYGDMHKVDIGTAAFNERAAFLYEDIGFKKEGIKREVLFIDRKWWDLIDLGMLEHEWEELRGFNKKKRDVAVRTQ